MQPLILYAAALAAHLGYVFGASPRVFAHLMVQNTYFYGQSDWQNEMNKAKAAGIDGFVLNWVPPYCPSSGQDLSWQISRIDDAFTVAENLGFHLFYSFDMSYGPGTNNCPSGNAWTTQLMANMTNKYIGRNALFSIDYAPVVSTYNGEAYGNAFLQEFKSLTKSTIKLAPAFTSYSYATCGSADCSDATAQAKKAISNFPAIDGFANWQAWPFNSKANLTGPSADLAYQNAFHNAGKKPYIMAVSPWQYKDLNNGVQSDSWVAYSDYLYPQRWEQAIQTVQPDIVEILTWNDFPESHYISDLPPQMAGAPEWSDLSTDGFGNYVYGHDHSAWRVMTHYYSNWLAVGGKAPTAKTDNLVFWYRTHPKQVACDGGNNGGYGIRNSSFPDDALFFWAVTTVNSTISVSVGSNKYWNSDAPAGKPVLGQIPFPSGLSSAVPSVAILRKDGGYVVGANGSLAITQKCSWQDYNPNVGLAGSGVVV